MSKDLEQAIKTHQSGSPEVKKALEDIFGKEAFQPKFEIGDYNDVCTKLGVSNDDSKIIVEVEGFDEGQINCVKAFIKKMRVCEAYNGAKKLVWGDKRYFAWYVRNSSGSGLAFDGSDYYDVSAATSSAARLSLKNPEHIKDFVKRFKYLDEQIIDL